MATRVRDIKTVAKVLTSDTSKINLGGQVPTGMKRWITFLSVDTMLHTGSSGFTIFLASVGVSNPTKASIIATGNRKYLLRGRATQSTGQRKYPVRIPNVPNPDTPLFSIASGKWLGAMATLTTVHVVMQYFDE